MTKPIVKNVAINYCISFKELKVFDKVANFLALADIKAFGRACLLACCF